MIKEGKTAYFDMIKEKTGVILIETVSPRLFKIIQNQKSPKYLPEKKISPCRGLTAPRTLR
jgi:hypothetical protein